MINQRAIGDLDSTATGEGRAQRPELPGTVDWSEVLRDGDPGPFPGAGPEPEGTTPTSAEERRRSVTRPDLRGHCPICDRPYRPSEGVLALSWLPSAADVGPSAPGAAGPGPGRPLVLGHHQCVLPRLLTLLAGFQPEPRFVTAVRDLPGGESAFPEFHHDEP